MSEEKQSPGTLANTILDGRYRIEKLLGEGGMGAVYAATDQRLEKRVAVKVMARELSANPEVLARFRREAQVTSSLGHPNIVQVFDFSTAPTGEPFLVMEFLDGEDLEHCLRRDGRLAPARMLHILKQIAAALMATHAKGIVHRDLKPANVYLLKATGAADFVKVLDFGISKVRDASTKLTKTSSIMGTPNYMSPEQALGRIEEIDETTDEWALACIAWECLSGQGPFLGDNVPSILYQVVHECPPALTSKVAGLPREVEEVLRCALAKDKRQRFASISAFASALEGACAEASPPGANGAQRTAGKRSVPGTTFTGTAGELGGPFKLPRRRRQAWAVGAGLAALLLLGAFLFLRPGPSPKPVTIRPPVASPLPVAGPPPAPPPAPVAVPTVAPLPPAIEPAKLSTKPEVQSSPPELSGAGRKPKKSKTAADSKANGAPRGSQPQPVHPTQSTPPPKKESEDKWRLD